MFSLLKCTDFNPSPMKTSKPFFKQVIRYLISKTEGSDGILVRDRFGFVAEEKNFRIVIALHINWVLITATKIYISVE